MTENTTNHQIIDDLTEAVTLLEKSTDDLTAIQEHPLADEVSQIEEILRDLMIKVWKQLDPEDYKKQTSETE
jgi:hypothetical protein